jgi:hypothetical protein
MMDQPFFLWALPLLALPWLLQLLRPQKPQRLFFPQMYLLREVILKVRLRKKPNPLWLNLIRCGLLLALLLSLIGVFWPTPTLNPEAAQILLIDDSFYAQADGERGTAGDFWAEQMESAHKLLAGMLEQQKVALVGLSGRPSSWLSVKEAQSEINLWTPSYKGEHWLSVGLQLDRLLRQSTHSALELHVLGEGYSETQQEAAAVLQKFSRQMSIHWPTPKPKKIIENFSLQVETWISATHLVASGRVVPSIQKPYTLRFKGMDGTVEEKTFEGSFRWEFPLTSSGFLELVYSDGFYLDQQIPISGGLQGHGQLFLWKHREAQQRLQDPDYYLEKALSQIAQEQHWDLNLLNPKDWKNLTGGMGDTLVIQDPPYLSENEAQSLERFWKKGGDIFVFLGPRTPLEIFDPCPWMPAQILSRFENDHTILWPKDWTGQCPLFEKLIFKGGWTFKQLHPQSKVLARRADGSPVWIEGPPSETGGRIHLLSSPFHLAWSKATLQADFPTALGLILKGDHEESLTNIYEAGSSFPKSVVATKTLLGSTSTNEMSPGIFELTHANGAVQMVMVRFSRDRYQQRTSIPRTDRMELAFVQTSHRQRMDVFFAVLLLLFLGAESCFLILHKKAFALKN